MRFRPRDSIWLEVILVSILTLVGFALRQANLMTVPPLTDEFKEVGWAMTMIEKNRWPLVAYDAYDGPLFPYLLSFLFRIFGYNLYLPRVLVLVVGVLTIVVVYLFARELAHGDLRVAFLAAALLAFNAHHILFNSHVAWSNDTTPFFTTLALWFYVRGTRGKRPRWLIAAGFAYGLAVQTHPSAIMLAPSFVIDFLAARATRPGWRTPIPYLAVLAALFAYSPVIYYNLTTHFGSLTAAQNQTYAVDFSPMIDDPPVRVGAVLATMGRITLGTFGNTGWGAIANDPRLILFWIATTFALVWLVKRGELYPFVALGSSLFVLGIFNHFYAVPDSGRYFQPLVPIIFAAWALASVHLTDLLFTPAPIQAGEVGQRHWLHNARWVIVALLLLAFVAVSLTSLTELNQYYASAYAQGQTNDAMLAMVQAVRADPDSSVFVDWNLGKLRTLRGGNVGEDIIYLLRLDRRNYQLVSVLADGDVPGLRNYLKSHPRAFLISFTFAPDVLGSDVPLDKLIETHFTCSACPVSEDFALFQWESP